MNERIEGTISLDGLIEGRLPPEGDTADKLRQWTRFAGELGLRFSVEVDGNNFSVLADNRPVPLDKLEPDPAQAIKEALDQLLSVFPAPQRTNLFSTLRASEYAPGKETQSLFAIGPDGRFAISERTVDAETQAPAAPLTAKERVKLGVFGLCAAVTVIAISALFIPYGEIWAGFFGSGAKVSMANTKLELGGFAEYIQVEEIKTDIVKRKRCLVLKLKRTEAYPKDADALQQLYADSEGRLAERLTVEALARGYLTAELFDDESEYLARFDVRITELRRKPSIEHVYELPRSIRPVRLRLTY